MDIARPEFKTQKRRRQMFIRVELDRTTGATLEHNGVLIQAAITGTVTALSP